MENTTTNPITTVSFWDNVALWGAKLVNNETTVGKTGNATKYLFYANIAVVVITALLASPQVFVALHWTLFLSILNILLVFLKGILDQNTKNI